MNTLEVSILFHLPIWIKCLHGHQLSQRIERLYRHTVCSCNDGRNLMSLWTIYTCEYAHDKKNIPYKLRDKWTRTACNIQEMTHRSYVFLYFGFPGALPWACSRAKGSSFATYLLTYSLTYCGGKKERNSKSSCRWTFIWKGLPVHILEGCALLEKIIWVQEYSYLQKWWFETPKHCTDTWMCQEQLRECSGWFSDCSSNERSEVDCKLQGCWKISRRPHRIRFHIHHVAPHYVIM